MTPVTCLSLSKFEPRFGGHNLWPTSEMLSIQTQFNSTQMEKYLNPFTLLYYRNNSTVVLAPRKTTGFDIADARLIRFIVSILKLKIDHANGEVW